MKRILIAGIGNIFHGDDAFGVEVAREMTKLPERPEVETVDFGIRVYDLACALIAGYDTIILVDAAPGGQPPGTISLIEPDLNQLNELKGPDMNAHTMTPVSAFQLARLLGEPVGKIFLVGCEPATLEPKEGDDPLSAAVRAAVPRAISLIESTVNDFLYKTQNATAGLAPA